MILGNICTRSCRFCGVETGKPNPVDPDEPDRVARSVEMMKLSHCVLTSVDRDDLDDGGAEIWSETIKKIKYINPQTTIEALVPDFRGKKNLLDILLEAKPEILSHNLETVEKITSRVRSVAKYRTSLDVLTYFSQSGAITKTGIMVGLGETEEEIFTTMDDALCAGCEIFTIGQYLQPSAKHIPVAEYIHPDKFDYYRETGLKKGFRFVESSPLVRSSYNADLHVAKGGKMEDGRQKSERNKFNSVI
jgi:lipoyl synthase